MGVILYFSWNIFLYFFIVCLFMFFKFYLFLFYFVYFFYKLDKTITSSCVEGVALCRSDPCVDCVCPAALAGQLELHHAWADGRPCLASILLVGLPKLGHAQTRDIPEHITLGPPWQDG